MKYKLILLLFALFTLPSVAQVKRYTANGVDGVILDWERASLNHLSNPEDRVQITTKEVDLFEKTFRKSYSRYNSYKRQYLGFRRNGKEYMIVIIFSERIAKNVNWTKGEYACMDCKDFFIVKFYLKSKEIVISSVE